MAHNTWLGVVQTMWLEAAQIIWLEVVQTTWLEVAQNTRWEVASYGIKTTWWEVASYSTKQRGGRWHLTAQNNVVGGGILRLENITNTVPPFNSDLRECTL